LSLLAEARDRARTVQGERHPAYASILNNMAFVYSETGEYSKALPLFVESGDIIKAALGEDHPDYAQSLHSQAGVYHDMGDHAKELPLLLRARDILKAEFGERHIEYAQSLNNLAALYIATGDYAKALPLLLQARDIVKATVGERDPLYGRCLTTLATLYSDMGDHQRALVILLESRDNTKAAVGDRHPQYARILSNLAVEYREMGDYANALPLFLQARELRKVNPGEHHPDYAQTLNQLALLYEYTGDNAKALALLLEARDIWKAALGERHISYVTSINNLAILYEDTGDAAKALPLLMEARDVTKSTLGEHQPTYAITLHNLAQYYDAAGDAEQALALYREAYRITQEVLDRAADGQAERQQMIMARAQRLHVDFYLSLLLRRGLPGAEAYATALDIKGAAQTRHKWDRLTRGSDPEATALVERLRTASAMLAARSLAAPLPRQQDAWRREMRGLEENRDRLEQQLAARSAAFRSDRARGRATVEQVGNAVPEGTAIVDFLEYTHCTPPTDGKGPWQFERRLLAFVVRQGRPLAAIQLGLVKPIVQAVNDWRRSVESVSLTPVDDEAARSLTRLVWRPLAAQLEGVSTVLVCPDGVLCRFPLAALPGDRRDSYLIEERAFGYLPSAREVIVADGKDGGTAAGLLAVGDVDYGERVAASTPAVRRPFFGPLPGTRPELDRVAAAHRTAFTDQNRQTLLTGPNADAVALKRELTAKNDGAGYRFVHLACHGFFLPLPPAPPGRVGEDLLPAGSGGARPREAVVRDPLLRSGLVLAGANRAPQTGTLTAAEVAGLDLRGCELAVLSACQTALGGVQPGEGVLGLQRAFNEAGARTLVASLWSVNDAGTSILMEEFYSNLWTRKLPKLEALRQAQLAVLRHPERVAKRADELRQQLAKRGVPADVLASRGFDWKEEKLPDAAAGSTVSTARRSHPALWAAFVLSGDYR
jgi:CHAT domain-containing protein